MSNAQQPSPIGDDLGLGLTLPGDSPSDALGRRHVHPITPIVHGVSVVPVIVLLVVASGGGVLAAFGWGIVPMTGLAVVVVGLAFTGWSYLAWRNLWYWFDDDGDFRVDSGVLTRKQRRLQLSRLQTVDVAQPLFARLFSMAEVSIEVAGSGDSRVKLRYLKLAQARSLRNEVLARAAGLAGDVEEAPESALATVPTRDLAVSLVMRTATAGLLLLTVAIFVFTVLSEGWGGLPLVLITGGVPILVVASEFMRYFRFTVSQSPDGLR
ncbi:MAG: PH domain-containing protein, partial [Actinomycetota bacterium]|nr:PH domain-containing protein [Actinomycetota bacterium]